VAHFAFVGSAESHWDRSAKLAVVRTATSGSRARRNSVVVAISMFAGKAHSQSMDTADALVPYAFWALVFVAAIGLAVAILVW
jgi:hypothetical protein